MAGGHLRSVPPPFPSHADAADLARLGLRPLWLSPHFTGGRNAGKQPLADKWQLSIWLHPDDVQPPPGPGCNLGMLCGDVPDAPRALVAVNCDSPAAVQWASENIPITPLRIITHRGELWCYRHPRQGIKIPLNSKLKGLPLEVIGDGAQVVTAPSIHKDGTIYRQAEPWDVVKMDAAPMFDPAWLADQASPAKDQPAAAKGMFKLGSEVEVGKRLVAELHSPDGTPPVYSRGKFHRYNPTTGIWDALVHAEVQLVVQGFDGMLINDGKDASELKISSRFREGVISCASVTTSNPTFFDRALTGFAFTNGYAVVTPNAVTLMPHSKDNRATAGVPFPFDAATPCARWLRFLREVFQHDVDTDDKQKCVQEFAGACITGRATNYTKALALTGVGENGKSIFINTILKLFPDDTKCAIKPQDWGNEYRRAMLAGKRINAVGEVPSAELMDSSSFKGIVDGEMTDGRPIRQDPFNFIPIAGHVFSFNQLPGTRDQSHGYWRRWIVIQFNRNFSNDKEAQSKESLEAELTAELPGIMVWVLNGAARLLQQAKLTIPSSHLEAIGQWRDAADQVRQFIQTCTEPADDNAGIAGKVLFDVYRDWTNWAGQRNALGLKTFLGRITQLGYPVHRAKDANRYPLMLRAKQDWDR